jgi:hypothetical protein
MENMIELYKVTNKPFTLTEWTCKKTGKKAKPTKIDRVALTSLRGQFISLNDFETKVSELKIELYDASSKAEHPDTTARIVRSFFVNNDCLIPHGVISQEAYDGLRKVA